MHIGTTMELPNKCTQRQLQHNNIFKKLPKLPDGSLRTKGKGTRYLTTI